MLPIVVEAGNTSNKSIPGTDVDYQICSEALYYTVGTENKIRVCDIILLIPNGLFLIYLSYILGIAHAKMSSVRCPIVKTVFSLVYAVSVVGVARCYVSMLLTASFVKHHADTKSLKALWLLLRCCLLGTELSVIIFAVYAANLDSRRSVQRVLCITSLIAIVYISVQAALEFDMDGRVSSYGGDYDLYMHGGMIFWFVSSFIFFMIYAIILILPYTNIQQQHRLPTKRSFYWYCAFLALINAVQSVGSVLVYAGQKFGTCLVDVTTFTYFALFAPLVYITFLSDFFNSEAIFLQTTSNPSYSYQPIPDSIITQDTGTYRPTSIISITGQPSSDLSSYGTMA